MHFAECCQLYTNVFVYDSKTQKFYNNYSILIMAICTKSYVECDSIITQSLKIVSHQYWSFIFFTSIIQLDNLYHLNYSRLSSGIGSGKIKYDLA